MPPCLDVYCGCQTAVLISSAPSLTTTSIDHYVVIDDPGDERLSAFVRTYLAATPDERDAAALAELRRATMTLAFRSTSTHVATTGPSSR
jgi:hypothetical protein